MIFNIIGVEDVDLILALDTDEKVPFSPILLRSFLVIASSLSMGSDNAIMPVKNCQPFIKMSAVQTLL